MYGSRPQPYDNGFGGNRPQPTDSSSSNGPDRWRDTTTAATNSRGGDDAAVDVLSATVALAAVNHGVVLESDPNSGVLHHHYAHPVGYGATISPWNSMGGAGGAGGGVRRPSIGGDFREASPSIASTNGTKISYRDLRPVEDAPMTNQVIAILQAATTPTSTPTTTTPAGRPLVANMMDGSGRSRSPAFRYNQDLENIIGWRSPSQMTQQQQQQQPFRYPSQQPVSILRPSSVPAVAPSLRTDGTQTPGVAAPVAPTARDVAVGPSDGQPVGGLRIIPAAASSSAPVDPFLPLPTSPSRVPPPSSLHDRYLTIGGTDDKGTPGSPTVKPRRLEDDDAFDRTRFETAAPKIPAGIPLKSVLTSPSSGSSTVPPPPPHSRLATNRSDVVGDGVTPLNYEIGAPEPNEEYAPVQMLKPAPLTTTGAAAHAERMSAAKPKQQQRLRAVGEDDDDEDRFESEEDHDPVEEQQTGRHRGGHGAADHHQHDATDPFIGLDSNGGNAGNRFAFQGSAGHTPPARMGSRPNGNAALPATPFLQQRQPLGGASSARKSDPRRQYNSPAIQRGDSRGATPEPSDEMAPTAYLQRQRRPPSSQPLPPSLSERRRRGGGDSGEDTDTDRQSVGRASTSSRTGSVRSLNDWRSNKDIIVFEGRQGEQQHLVHSGNRGAGSTSSHQPTPQRSQSGVRGGGGGGGEGQLTASPSVHGSVRYGIPASTQEAFEGFFRRFIACRRGPSPNAAAGALPSLPPVPVHVLSSFHRIVRNGSYFIKYPYKSGSPHERFFSLRLVPTENYGLQPYLEWATHRDASSIKGRVHMGLFRSVVVGVEGCPLSFERFLVKTKHSDAMMMVPQSSANHRLATMNTTSSSGSASKLTTATEIEGPILNGGRSTIPCRLAMTLMFHVGSMQSSAEPPVSLLALDDDVFHSWLSVLEFLNGACPLEPLVSFPVRPPTPAAAPPTDTGVATKFGASNFSGSSTTPSRPLAPAASPAVLTPDPQRSGTPSNPAASPGKNPSGVRAVMIDE